MQSRKAPSASRAKSKNALLRRLDSQLLASGAAAAAAAAVGNLTASEAQATIHYSGLLDISILTSTPAGLYIDVDGLTTGVTGAGTPGWEFNIFNVNFTSGGKSVYFYGAPVGGGGPHSTTTNPVGTVRAGSPALPYVSKLAQNTAINGSSTFVSPADFVYNGTTYTAVPLFLHATTGGAQYFPANSPWKGGVTNGYMGFEFQLGGTTHFGWARFNVGNISTGFQTVLRDFAYEDQANTAIPAGAVPEPATATALGLLAL